MLIDCIKSDLKRKPLKKFKSLRKDTEKAVGIIRGKIEEMGQWPPSFELDRALITKIKLGSTTIYCYKRNVPVISAGLLGNKGCRLIYGVYGLGIEDCKIVPILLYAAKEEKTMYSINNKSLQLSLSGIKEIVKEKIKLLG